MPSTKIRRALISVYDKTGIVEFARALVDEFGIEIISTGGTAKLLKENAIPVTLVEEITGFGEMLDGRVKTLHPKIHAAILADRDNPEHMRQLAEQGIEPIDMVVVNLYPFEETVAKPDCTFDEAIEMIDIGGPCLLRAAAKNHKHVLVCVHSWSYDTECLRNWNDTAVRDRALVEGAVAAFWQTTTYDGEIQSWLSADDRVPGIPDRLVRLMHGASLRYGENAHQEGGCFGLYNDARCNALYCEVGRAEQALSFNNYHDANAAFELCADLSRALRVICVGPAFQPVSPRVKYQRHTERHLPHIEDPGATYFVTFRLRTGRLTAEEQAVVSDACKFWHGKKMTVHASVVMPDHVHLLVTPHETAPGEWIALGEILQSIKGYSARQINEARGTRGSLWLDESWDRIVRSEKEFGERWEYIESNPGKAGLGDHYRFLWLNHQSWEDLDDYYRGHPTLAERRLAAQDRLESRSHTEADGQPDADATCTPPPAVCAFIKHTNACGVGVGGDPWEAYQRAYLGDPNAAMGGILVCDFEVTVEFAEAVMDTYARWGKAAGAGGFFVEVWLAPSFRDDRVVEFIRTRKEWGKRVRLLDIGSLGEPPGPGEVDLKRVVGGMLVQSRDLVGLNEDEWKVVTDRQPTERELADLRLAWLICKHTKSNAITVCAEGMLIGNGAGQMSRVMSCRIATWLAAENGHSDKLKGAAAASDAFFPFRDGPDILMEAGVTAIIQPGGSKRDQEVIDACNERKVAMIFTGTRHFKH